MLEGCLYMLESKGNQLLTNLFYAHGRALRDRQGAEERAVPFGRTDYIIKSLTPAQCPYLFLLPIIMSQPEHSDSVSAPVAKAAPGSTWNKEIHVVPRNNLPVVFTGLALCIFLAALDQVCLHDCVWPLLDTHINLVQTIVATALPTIVSKLGGGNGYSWVGRCVLALALSLF
jgi:hypothetical protein